MANYCTTDIVINHDDEDKIKELFEKIKNWINNPFSDEFKDCCTDLINIAKNADVYSEDLYLRGSVFHLSMHHNEITICEEVKWNEAIQIWKRICDKYLPDSIITFATEVESEYYSNDSNYIGNYNIDVFDVPEGADVQPMYCAEHDDVVDILQDVLKSDTKDLQSLLEELESSDIDWLYIHQWQEMSIDECC